MKKKKLLDSIDVQSPCNESWDEMFGNDEVRFCSHCAKNVHNLSAMTRQKAEELVKNSSGKLCVRYVKNPNGKIVTAPPKLTKITHQATIAASVLATSLTLSTIAYSQGEPIVKKGNLVQTQKNTAHKNESKQEPATISGTVKDVADAVIANAKVTLRDTKTQKVRIVTTNDSGFYEFKDVEPSIYEITIVALGFESSTLKDMNIFNNTKIENQTVLKVAELMGEVIFIEISTRISGLIKDQGDWAIPDAKITLRNTKTEKVLETKSNSEGFYDFIDFEPGNYEIKVEKDGFKKLIMQNIEISADTKLERNLDLDAGGIICELPLVVDSSEESKVKNKSIINKKPKSSKPKKKKN